MAHAKNQHYVPQFYLRKFASYNEQLSVFDKSNRREFRAHIKNIGSGTHFYDLPIAELSPEERETLEHIGQKGGFDATDPHFIEKFLGLHETIYSRILEEVLLAFESHMILSEEQRYCLAQFMMMQSLRTVEVRETLRQIEETVVNLVYEDAFPLAQHNLRLTLSDEYIRLSHIARMFDADLHKKYMKWLLHHIWLIGVNQTNEPLYTSDHPIVQRSIFTEGAGVGSLGVEISFPLSPKYCLLLSDRRVFDLIAPYHLCFIPLTNDDIHHLNELQTLQSFRQVYSTNDNFTIAQETCQANPHISLPHRSRIITIMAKARPMKNSQQRKRRK